MIPLLKRMLTALRFYTALRYSWRLSWFKAGQSCAR